MAVSLTSPSIVGIKNEIGATGQIGLNSSDIELACGNFNSSGQTNLNNAKGFCTGSFARDPIGVAYNNSTDLVLQPYYDWYDPSGNLYDYQFARTGRTQEIYVQHSFSGYGDVGSAVYFFAYIPNENCYVDLQGTFENAFPNGDHWYSKFEWVRYSGLSWGYGNVSYVVSNIVWQQSSVDMSTYNSYMSQGSSNYPWHVFAFWSIYESAGPDYDYHRSYITDFRAKIRT